MSVYDEVKKALQDIVAPQIAELRGEIEARFAQVETRFTQMEAHTDARFAELRSEIAQLRSELRQEISNLHTDLVRVEQVFDARLQAIGVLERVVRLEERVGRS